MAQRRNCSGMSWVSPPAAFAAGWTSTRLATSTADGSADTSSPFELSLRILGVGCLATAAPRGRGHRRSLTMHPVYGEGMTPRCLRLRMLHKPRLHTAIADLLHPQAVDVRNREGALRAGNDAQVQRTSPHGTVMCLRRRTKTPPIKQSAKTTPRVLSQATCDKSYLEQAMLKSVVSSATAADSSDSSESSSDGASTALISWERYKAADIAGGLLRKRDFVRAARELTAILRRRVNYAALVPALQTALLEDCHLAVEQCDRYGWTVTRCSVLRWRLSSSA